MGSGIEDEVTLQFDEAYSQRLLALYLTPDVVAQRDETLRALALRPGDRVLDIGTGPGLLAVSMAAAVGPSGRISAIDVSENVLELARRQIGTRSTIEVRKADATDLPYGDGTFDVGVSTQVYEYVPDVARALRELFRVLRRPGKALIIDTDWDSMVWRSSDDGRMAKVLSAWNEHAVHPDLPRRLPPMLRAAGFSVEKVWVIPLLTVGRHENTYSAGLMQFIAAFASGRHGLTEDDLRSWSDDLRRLGEQNEYFLSLNRFVFLATKPPMTPQSV